MTDPLAPTPLKLTPDMFTGQNKIALRAIFQKFASPRIIVADIELEIDRTNLTRTVIVTYCREGEGKMTKQFDPKVPTGSREHEFPAHQFRIRTERGSMYLDPTMLISKFALIGGQ